MMCDRDIVAIICRLTRRVVAAVLIHIEIHAAEPGLDRDIAACTELEVPLGIAVLGLSAGREFGIRQRNRHLGLALIGPRSLRVHALHGAGDTMKDAILFVQDLAIRKIHHEQSLLISIVVPRITERCLEDHCGPRGEDHVFDAGKHNDLSLPNLHIAAHEVCSRRQGQRRIGYGTLRRDESRDITDIARHLHRRESAVIANKRHEPAPPHRQTTGGLCPVVGGELVIVSLGPIHQPEFMLAIGERTDFNERIWVDAKHRRYLGLGCLGRRLGRAASRDCLVADLVNPLPEMHHPNLRMGIAKCFGRFNLGLRLGGCACRSSQDRTNETASCQQGCSITKHGHFSNSFGRLPFPQGAVTPHHGRFKRRNKASTIDYLAFSSNQSGRFWAPTQLQKPTPSP